MNKKRVQRLWGEADPKVPAKQHKRRRLGSSRNGRTKRRTEYVNHVWAYDFAMGSTEDGRRLKQRGAPEYIRSDKAAPSS